jgi:CRISPR/Cas system-associated endonuclease Cas1
MKRTLYLCESKGLSIRRDGPSVWIEQAGVAGRRVPVQMLERVVIMGSVEINTLVLSLFSSWNIPVSIFTRKGDVVSVMVRYDESFPENYHRQKIFHRSEFNMERFRNITRYWRRETQKAALNRYSKRLYTVFRDNGYKETFFQKIIEHETIFLRERYQMVYRIVYGMFGQLILSVLRDAGLDPGIGVIHRRHPHGLVKDIAHMIEAEIHMQALQLFKTRAAGTKVSGIGVTSDGMRDIALRFENRRKAIVCLINRVVDNILEAMRDLEVRGRTRRRKRENETKVSCLL